MTPLLLALGALAVGAKLLRMQRRPLPVQPRDNVRRVTVDGGRLRPGPVWIRVGGTGADRAAKVLDVKVGNGGQDIALLDDQQVRPGDELVTRRATVFVKAVSWSNPLRRLEDLR